MVSSDTIRAPQAFQQTSPCALWRDETGATWHERHVAMKARGLKRSLMWLNVLLPQTGQSKEPEDVEGTKQLLLLLCLLFKSKFKPMTVKSLRVLCSMF